MSPAVHQCPRRAAPSAPVLGPRHGLPTGTPPAAPADQLQQPQRRSQDGAGCVPVGGHKWGWGGTVGALHMPRRAGWVALVGAGCRAPGSAGARPIAAGTGGALAPWTRPHSWTLRHHLRPAAARVTDAARLAQDVNTNVPARLEGWLHLPPRRLPAS